VTVAHGRRCGGKQPGKFATPPSHLGSLLQAFQNTLWVSPLVITVLIHRNRHSLDHTIRPQGPGLVYTIMVNCSRDLLRHDKTDSFHGHVLLPMKDSITTFALSSVISLHGRFPLSRSTGCAQKFRLVRAGPPQASSVVLDKRLHSHGNVLHLHSCRTLRRGGGPVGLSQSGDDLFEIQDFEHFSRLIPHKSVPTSTPHYPNNVPS